MIYATGDAAGVDLRTKKISDMTDKELSTLADGVSKFEGWHEGRTLVLTAPQVSNLQAGQKQRQENSQNRSTVLRQGIQGDDVKRAQEELQDLGYLKGTADSHFGPRTKAATEDFQRAQGLEVDGKIGHDTRQRLDAAVRDKQIENMAPGTGPRLRDFSDPGDPQNALYNVLKNALPPGTSEERITQATATCYRSGAAEPKDLSSITIGDTYVTFGSSLLFASTARMDISQPAPSVQQTMQQVQQFDQHKAQVQTQVQSQILQNNTPAQQGPVPGGPGMH